MGRFPHRRPGCGGRGRSNDRNQNNTTVQKKKALEDHHFYVGSSKQASDFETTYEFLLNHIKRTYARGNVISKALRTMEDPDEDTWKPKLEFS